MKKLTPMPVTSVARKAETFLPMSGESIEGETKQLMDRLLPSATVKLCFALERACPDGWCLRDRAITEDMWFCIISGKYFCKCDTMLRPAMLTKGDMFFVPRNCIHTIGSKTGKCKMYAIHFQAECLGHLPLCTLLGMQGVYRKDHFPLLDISESLCWEFARKVAGWEQCTCSGIWQVLRELLRKKSKQFKPTVKEDTFLLHARLQPVLEHIEQELTESSLSIVQLAGVADVSTVTLNKWFLEAFNKSPVSYIRSRKIDRACRLLMNGDISIKQIAVTCGYSDISFFYRVFKKEMGLTPAEYRSGARLL